MNGWEAIVPFLRPVEHLLFDPEVSEIARNGNGMIFAERCGVLSLQKNLTIDEPVAMMAMQNIARALLDDFDAKHPLLDASLPDGSRVSARWKGISRPGMSFNIRKFNNRRYTLEELIRSGSVQEDDADALVDLLRTDHTILIGGGTSTGKTTLLNALSPHMGDCRVVVIEDTPELQLHQTNAEYWTARKAAPELPAVTIRDLIRAAKRARPDRIIVGEVRGPEALDLLDALSSGHGGSMATIHAGSPAECLRKLSLCVMQARDMPERAINGLIAHTIDAVVTLVRDPTSGRRFVQQIAEVSDYNWETNEFLLDYGN